MGINYFLNGQKTSKHKMLITFYTVDYFSKLFCRKHSSETGRNEKEEQNSNKPSTTNKTKKNVTKKQVQMLSEYWNQNKNKNVSISITVQPKFENKHNTENINFWTLFGFQFFVGSYETTMSVWPNWRSSTVNKLLWWKCSVFTTFTTHPVKINTNFSLLPKSRWNAVNTIIIMIIITIIIIIEIILVIK